MLRMVIALLLTLSVTVVQAQENVPPPPDRSATGGAQTLEDILARQRGEVVDAGFRSQATGQPEGAAGLTAPLGTLGGASDPEIWRALRFGEAKVTSTSHGPAAATLIQDGGLRWLEFRQGPLATWGAYLLGGTILLLALFYLIRGRIRMDGEKTGRRIKRFAGVERFGHWLLAGSFILLGLTGLLSLFGRKYLIPTFGREAFADVAMVSKWIHNNVAWAFIIALVMVFVMWVVHNLPDRSDITWVLKGGGIFSKAHPPARKFNAGQKLIFWSVVLFGASISVSGLALLFPFELNMFAATFAKLNNWGISEAIGLGQLPTALAPHEEMQLAQLWHAIVGFVLMAIVLAHIYIGTLGMEGAFDAMASGEVEEQWAREHHSLWVDEVKARQATAPESAISAE